MAQTCAGRTAVVIPAYKPDDRLPPYVQALKDAGIGRIVVVDDGSGQDYQRFFDQIPRDGVSHVISYQPNCGKGVALKDNKFIGPPMVKMAQTILSKHRMIQAKCKM